MDVFNKFYSSVSNTVSQLSGVLPGNPVTREFEITNHVASAGPGLLWKVYSGYKKSTKQEASIFLLEKRLFEGWSKSDREATLESLKRGIGQLTRLRHPQILVVQHPLEESRESLAFATEPVFASLANILGNNTNLPSPPHLRDYKLFELEIKYGLMQIGQGLTFLHNDVKLLHRNICPECVVVNALGAWKIFGFEFCVGNRNSTPGSPPHWPFEEFPSDGHPCSLPNLDYLAPEMALTLSHSPASDLFSLGALSYALFSSGGQAPLRCEGQWSRFARSAAELKRANAVSGIDCVPEGLRDCVRMMLSATPELRPDAHQFIKIEYFEDVGVKTLNYLDSLFQWDNLQKSQFYKGLPQVIPKLPHRVCLYRIIPCLVKEFVNASMVPFVLPNVMAIAQNCSREEFEHNILPHLLPVMKIQDPIQILLIFMQRMALLLKLTPASVVRSDVMPMLHRALDSDAQPLQELCLSVLPSFASLIDYTAVKNALIPRLKRLALTTPYVSVRVNCLVCVGRLLEHLDKWLVLDEVLPLLPQIPSREPAVLMGILGIYKLALTHERLGITKEVMATQVLPFLLPLLVENGLSLPQFNALAALIKDMVTKVETEHRAKITQLSSIQQEQTSALQMALASGNPENLVPLPNPQSDLDSMLSELGLEDCMKNINGSAEVAPKSEASNFDSILTNAASSTSPTSLLTIEDKLRFSKQKLQMQQIQALDPRPTETARFMPKDIETSLLEKNLSEMSRTQSGSKQTQFFQVPAANMAPFPPPPKHPPPQVNTDGPRGGGGASAMWPMGNLPSSAMAFPSAASNTSLNPLKSASPSGMGNAAFRPSGGQSMYEPLLGNSNMVPLAATTTPSPLRGGSWNVTTPLLPFTPQSPQSSGVKTLSTSEINDLLS
ncbi:SCY1-like protein 2 [Hetaerina americana]|uniref:SCY1-like protein 2 n=1 Tax=Hetaerina americana TaxID=62018 RepID=UPI003A7F23C8